MGAILWLASYPKSGNTWMRAFLHNLLRNPDQPFDINNLTNFTLGESLTPWFQKLDPRPASEYSFEEVAAMRPQVHRMMTEASPDTVFAKIHNMLAESFGHPLVNMDVTAGAIYMVRNPLDVAISYAHHMGVSVDDSITVMNKPGAHTGNDDRHVYEHQGSWTENVLSWTQRPMPQLHVVRFEDMLHLPLKTFGKVATFLGMKPPKARLEKAIRFSSFRVLRQQEQEHGFKERAAETREFFRKGEAGQWRNTLSPEQVKRIVEANREQMARFDYLPKEFT
jgi:hypothetical protein